MSNVLAKWGAFKFEMTGPAFEKLCHDSEARLPSVDVLHRRPAVQFVGPGHETISLTGTVWTQEFEGFAAVERMRAAKHKGERNMLVSGWGHVFGKFSIQHIKSDQDLPFADGAPRRAQWTIDFLYAGEGAAAIGGGLLGLLDIGVSALSELF